MRVTELQEACNVLGIVHEGLNKRGLILALQRHAAGGEEDEGRNGTQDEGSEDAEVTFRAAVVPDDSDNNAVGSAAAADVEQENDAEPESARVMQLKLALARENREIEKERDQREKERDERMRLAREREFEMETERAALRDGSRGLVPARSVRPEIQSMLPRMSQDDPIVFFQAFEKSLILNDVDKCEWSKFLPANLTPKANKVLAGLPCKK